MTGQGFYVPTFRPVPECFHRIVDLRADLSASDFVKLPIGFGSPVDVVHKLLYKLKISLRQVNNRDQTDRRVEVGQLSRASIMG